TKDGRILTLNMELPLINNVDSPNILPEGYDELPTEDIDYETTAPPDYNNTKPHITQKVNDETSENHNPESP
ncbi:MAG: hypothetical protein RMJ36_05800, partial [Candidatus Calescibacterium sp.]|nr:hypothetical protein [Candidatus Calescibacterium sp.]MDW8133149.1 hypothetical protein [Candidatus Calescibacterium sp.]